MRYPALVSRISGDASAALAPRSPHERPGSQRFRGDDGSMIVEAAFITPVFFLLLFGILEFSAMFRDYLTLGNAGVAASRAASIAANDKDADYTVLQAVKKESSAFPSGQINRIVIFKAGSSTDTATMTAAGCKTANVGTYNGGSVTAPATGSCNVYKAADLSKTPESPPGTPTGYFRCTLPTALDQYYCPTGRKYAASNAAGHGPPDYIGIYLEINHNWITRLFGNNVTMSNYTITRIEPKSAA